MAKKISNGMKKTVTINLVGAVFNIEEDAYGELKSYLDSISGYFADYDDKEEIIKDIEARAAERFSEKISGAVQVITLWDVRELAKAMGTVEDIAGADKSERPKKAPEGASWKKKKLYRDPDNAVISGVAAGLASYFGIDPVIVRLIFAASLFFGGAGVIAYIILWLIVPEAKTTSEKMEMRGDEVNLANLKEAVEEKIVSAKKNFNASRPLRNISVAIGNVAKVFASVILMIIGLSILIGASAALIAIFFAVGNLLFNANSPYIDFPIKEFLPGINYFLVISAGFLAAAIPAVFGIFIGLSLMKRKAIGNLVAGLMLLAVWIVSLTALGIYAVRVAPQMEERERLMEQTEKATANFDFRDFSSIRASGNYAISVVRGDDYKIEAAGRAADLEAVDIGLVGQELRITEGKRERICIFCFGSSHKKTINITMPELSQFSSDGIVRSDIAGFSRDKMDLNLNGATRTTAEINVKSVSIKIDGISRLDLKGTANDLKIRANGAASIEADELETKNATVSADGSSKVRIRATERLDASADGASRINYLGDPEITKKTAGAARIQKVN